MDRFVTVLDNLQFVEEIIPQEFVIEKTAFQMLLEREVTVRYLNPAAANDPRLRSQFIKDARTLASLRHRNIVHVYEAGINEDNSPYLVLEKPEGITAQQRIARVSNQDLQMNIGEVLQVMSGLSEGLEYLHQQNVILHSLSPEQILLTRDKTAILTSLGQPIPDNPFNVLPEMVAYAPPEQLFNNQGDVRSDVYRLGVLLYHLLFGKLPFKEDIYGIVAQKQNGINVPAFQAFNPDFSGSDALRQMLCRALATRPGDRYASVGSFRTALSDVLNPQSVELRLPSILVQSFQNGSHHSPVLQPIPIDPLYQNGSNGNGTANKMGLSSNGKSKEQPVASALPDQYAMNHTLNSSSNGHPAKPVESNGQAKNEEAVSDLDAAAEENERTALDQEEISPLMPGLDNPALETAIPYTILVPMPDETVDEPASAPASPVAPTSTNTLSKYKRTLGIAALGAMGIIAALNLG